MILNYKSRMPEISVPAIRRILTFASHGLGWWRPLELAQN